MTGIRFWSVTVLLAVTAVLMHGRRSSQPTAVTLPMSQFPVAIGGWTGADQPLDDESLKFLGNGDHVTRLYTQSQRTPPIGLFIVYYPVQKTGVVIHSPKHCLPGAGWSFESSQYLAIADAGGKPHRAGEYVISQGGSRYLVLYWYQVHGRSIAREYVAKCYFLADAVRTNRSDGALVRVMTAIDPSPGEGVPAARSRAESFTAQLFPLLPRFVPD